MYTGFLKIQLISLGYLQCLPQLFICIQYLQSTRFLDGRTSRFVTVHGF